jgi:hypothetical protein
MLDTGPSGETLIYRIDAEDRLVHVSNGWEVFARENQGDGCAAPANVLGRSLWDFIHDLETRHLYGLLLERVRTRGSALQVPIRCDSPSLCREIEITVVPLPGGGVEFQCRTVGSEEREPAELLLRGVPRSMEIVRICCFCKRIAVSDTEWVDLAEAIRRLGLFQAPLMPQLNHRVCPPCCERVMAILET